MRYVVPAVRRLFLLLLALGLLSACQPVGQAARLPEPGSRQGLELALPPPGFALDTTPARLDRPTRAGGEEYQGPLIDTHVHLLRGLAKGGVARVLTQMEKAGVEGMVVLPTPNEGLFRDREANAKARRQIVAAGAGRVSRLCGSTYLTRWMAAAYVQGYSDDDLADRLGRLRRDLESGGCSGIGEIGPYHFAKKPGMAVIHFPLNFTPMLELARLAAAERVWLDLHAEPKSPTGDSYEQELFGGIELLFREAPGLKLILSHTGMTSAVNARRLLAAYPNLMMNLKIVRPGRKLQWDHLGPIVDENGRLFEDWARLMEEMPDRFMVGTDARFGTPQYGKGRYRKTIRAIRRLLGSLDPQAARMIGAENARRVFGL